MKTSPQRLLIPIAVFIALLCALLFYFSPLAAAISGGCALLLLLICFHSLRERHRMLMQEVDNVMGENMSAAGKLIAAVDVPCMLFDMDGRVIWRNPAMHKLFDGKHIKPLPPVCQPQHQKKTTTMGYKSGYYQVINIPVERAHALARPLNFQYWLDRTEAEHYSRLHEEQMPYVGLIYVDNYEDLSSDLQYHRNTVITEVERLIADMVISIEGIYRRYDNGRFIIIFEAKHLARMQEERFALLEQVQRIDTGIEQKASLSIAIGVASRIAQSDTDARQAMELALGRGGDQAVIKRGTKYEFFGGRRQLESGQSRVKARLFAKALRQLIENSTEVFVMGHRQPDMDCIGAALGIARCAIQAGCRAHIVLDEVNPTIQQAVDSIRTNPAYAGVLQSPEAVRSMMRGTSVLVIVDTQRANSTIAPELLSHEGKTVLIDHHRRSTDYIDNATLNHLDARASSASEMVTETIQYFDDKIRPTAFECSVLLAGITVDTKHFAFNVGARTFEAAAYLRQLGADIGMVKLMFQDDRQTYSARVDTVKNAVMIVPGVALAACRTETENAPLIAAQAADELVGIRGIDTAFTLGQKNGGINVSGRSLGRVNVQLILERIGGGGHLTMAGAQLNGMQMDEAVELVKSTVLACLNEHGT